MGNFCARKEKEEEEETRLRRALLRFRPRPVPIAPAETVSFLLLVFRASVLARTDRRGAVRTDLIASPTFTRACS